VQCTVQTAGTGGRIGKQVRNPVNGKRPEVQNGSVATRKFLSIIHTCGGRMEIEWAKDISDERIRISSHVQFDTKIVQLFRSANTGNLNLYMKQNTESEIVANI
jgi:hypothetical protein